MANILVRLVWVFALSLSLSLVVFVAWMLGQPSGTIKGYEDWFCDAHPELCRTMSTPTSQPTATTSPGVAVTPQGVSYPRAVSAEELKGLCKYSGELGSSSTVKRTKHYEEVDGRFELVREDMSISSIDANLNMQWTFIDENGVKYFETYYVDGFTYTRVSEDEADGWNVEASPGFWGDLIPDADDPVGPTGRVIDLPDGSDTVCAHSPEDLEDVTDYGMEMLDGVRVRHVGVTLKPRPYDRSQMIVEYWVDLDGQGVQIKDTRIWASRGEYPDASV